MKQLSEKVVAITGAGSGIGKALALRMAKEGSILALIDINESYLHEVYQEILRHGGAATVHRTDIACRESVHRLSEEVIQAHGRLDVLINNAGVSLARMPVHEISWEQWEWIMKVNFWGTLHCTKAFYPRLLERPEAHIVNVSSVFSLGGVADRSAYCASKFAVRGLTEAMIQEVKHTPVSITSVLPGGMSSRIAQHCKGWQDQKLKSMLAERHRKQALTSPEEAAGVIIRAIKKKKKRVLIGKDAHFMDFILRYFGRYAEWVLRLLVLGPEKRIMQRKMRSTRS